MRRDAAVGSDHVRSGAAGDTAETPIGERQREGGHIAGWSASSRVRALFPVHPPPRASLNSKHRRGCPDYPVSSYFTPGCWRPCSCHGSMPWALCMEPALRRHGTRSLRGANGSVRGLKQLRQLSVARRRCSRRHQRAVAWPPRIYGRVLRLLQPAFRRWWCRHRARHNGPQCRRHLSHDCLHRRLPRRRG